MVCGNGGATIDGRTILAEMTGEVFIEAGGVRQKVCGGTQRFTFSRVTPYRPRAAMPMASAAGRGRTGWPAACLLHDLEAGAFERSVQRFAVASG